jgi:lipid-A-disaccharide synthase
MSAEIHIGIVAGEASGDLLGASLIRRLREHFPQLRISGVGGDSMISEGMESLYEIERLSVMGFVEPLKRLPELLKMRRKLVRHFCRAKVDVFIGIDSPDFNLGIAKRLHGEGLKTVQYVSPSVWAWRQGRVKGIRKSIDLMLTLFPFESQFYEREGVPVKFVGHPLASDISQAPDKESASESLGLVPSKQRVALLPGSRLGEIEMMWPVFAETIERLVALKPELEFIVPAANKPIYDILAEKVGPGIQLLLGQARTAVSASDAVLLASGTSTLEVMLLNRPMVVAYRLGQTTYQIARHLVRTPFISIPNLLAGKALVPEYIQKDAKPKALASSLIELLDDADVANQQLQAFQALKAQLERDSSVQAARAISDLLHSRG